MNRYKRQEIANDTLNYMTSHEEEVNSIYYSDKYFENKKKQPLPKKDIKTEIDVRYQDVVWTIIKEDPKVTVLNFASAKHPGGGWIKGSQSQEEAIARVSTLYNHIKDVNAFYKNPKHFESGYYDNDLIYSKDVKLIKNPDGKQFKDVIPFDVITCAAVNVSALRDYDEDKVNREMKTRIENILEIAIQNNVQTLVLGAFGTGVFKNNPVHVARIFKEVIHSERYKNQIPKIIFPIIGEQYLVDIFKNVK